MHINLHCSINNAKNFSLFFPLAYISSSIEILISYKIYTQNTTFYQFIPMKSCSFLALYVQNQQFLQFDCSHLSYEQPELPPGIKKGRMLQLGKGHF